MKKIEPSHYAVKIIATNDINGNPRRGWLVYGGDYHHDLEAFIDEGYAGDRNLKRRFPNCKVLCELHVPVSEYREALRNEKRLQKRR